MYGRIFYIGLLMEYIVSEGILDYYNDVMDDDYLGFVDIDEIV